MSGCVASACPTVGPSPFDEVEHALRYAGLVQNFSEDDGIERRDLARLEHHGTSCGQGGADFACDLVQRPVPRRDQPDDADRLLHNERGALDLLEREGLEDVGDLLKMCESDTDLVAESEWTRCTHLARNRKGQVAAALLINRDDALQQVMPFGRARTRVAPERALRRRDGLVHVCFRSERNLRDGVFVGRIDHVNRVRHAGIDPYAVDVELQVVRHLALRDCRGTSAFPPFVIPDRI